MGETNALRSIAVGLASARLAAHKTMEKPCMKTFFFKYILMKDIWFNILQTYTKQVRVDTIFKSLLRVTRNLLERTQTSRHLYISLVK